MAPEDARTATLTVSIDTDITHPDPNRASGCYVSFEHHFGFGTGAAHLCIGPVAVAPDGRPYYYIWAYGDELFSENTESTWAGTDAAGKSCAKTVTSTSSNSWHGYVRSYQHPGRSFRSGESVAQMHSKCGGNTYEECVSSQYIAGTYDPELYARWSFAAKECSGYSQSWNIGNNDRLFLFDPCQTKSLGARTSFLENIPDTPKVCDYSFVKRLNKACTVYKAVTAVQWGQADWFMQVASMNDGCGIWVVDSASWRSPKIKVATRSDGSDLVMIDRGASVRIKTATGAVTATCPV